jgi:hypothetical protein
MASSLPVPRPNNDSEGGFLARKQKERYRKGLAVVADLFSTNIPKEEGYVF